MRTVKNKYKVLEIALYIALFTYIAFLFLPIMDNLYGMVDRSVWLDIDALQLSILTLSPVLILLLLNSLVLVPKLLFTRGREWWYVIAIFGVIFTYMFLCRVWIDNFQSSVPKTILNLEERRKLQSERVRREKEWIYNRRYAPAPPYFPLPFAPVSHNSKPHPYIFNKKSDIERSPTIIFINWFEDKMFSAFVPSYSRMMMIFLIIVFNVAVKLFFRTLRKEEQYQKVRNDALTAELAYLKYQVNPHFFMNTLNNIYSLINIDGEKAKESILDMSKIMRHILYESNKDFISLNKEIEFLRNYIDLMKIRISDDVKLEIDFPDTDPIWSNKMYKIKVPPLLFISFIENSFKHGVSYNNPSKLKYSIKLDSNRLHFFTENPIHRPLKKGVGGFGISNVKKRLKLLYGKSVILNIEEKNNIYSVNLIIPT